MALLKEVMEAIFSVLNRFLILGMRTLCVQPVSQPLQANYISAHCPWASELLYLRYCVVGLNRSLSP